MKKYLILFAVLLLISCSSKFTELGMVSHKNLDLNEKKIELVSKNAIGKDVQHIIIFIPTNKLDISNAVADALNKYNADYLLNAVVYYEWFYIPYLYGQLTYKITGDAYKIRKEVIREYGFGKIQKF